MLANYFASPGESLSPDQICLFDDGESTATPYLATEADDALAVASHRRGKGVHMPLASYLFELPHGDKTEFWGGAANHGHGEIIKE